MEWNIAKSERCCARCEAVFEEGQAYTSAIYEQDADFTRKDYCPACWENEIDHEAVFSFWRTRVPRKDEQRRVFVDDSVIMDFFRRLAGSDEPKSINFRYIIALMLMRKRQLKLTDVRREGDPATADRREYLILKVPREDSTHEVLNPQLNDEQLEQVQRDLSQILETSL